MEPNNFFHIAENFMAFQIFLIVISVPFFCALCISLFHRFIFGKEFFSIFSSLVVVFFNFSLVLSFLEGNSFNFELIEVFPNVGLSFHIEPIGLVFSSIAAPPSAVLQPPTGPATSYVGSSNNRSNSRVSGS